MGVLVSEVRQPPGPGALDRWGEWLASRRAGQLIFRGVDSILRLVEKSLMWSTQVSQRGAVVASGEAGAGDVSKETSLVIMTRPLSWPLFIPLLGVLGFARVTVYFVTRVLRKPRDTTDMIHWLQSQRRWLRAIKNAGMKNIRLKQLDPNAESTPNGTTCGKKSAQSPDHERKRKYEDVEQSDWTDGSDDESVAVKLDKCSKDYDSETDPDFVPSSEDDSSEDEGSATSGDEDIEDEEGAVLVNEADVPVADAVSVSSPAAALSPSIVTVESPESVSDYGKTDAESTASTGSSVATTPLSPRSKLVKFFRRGNKTKQLL